MMTKKNLSIKQKRTEALYEREIFTSIYNIVRLNSLPLFPVSYCETDKKFQNIYIYLQFEKNKENEETINNFKKKYYKFIIEDLIKSKKFRKIPKLIFLFDNELNKINKLEEIIKNIK